ncbi:hypothetical protein ACUXZZ_45320 (plasmid) [Streptomyces graminifolii]|uniref:hypothetical protein n=1 Tax=Streptomyces graminifolii TaxID=1266771 RepID=UPI00405A4BB7
MNRTARTTNPNRRALVRRALTTATHTAKALGYATLSGRIGALVADGRLIRTGDFLDRVGGADLKDGFQSWYGRHVIKAYRAAHDADAPRVWARHRTTGKWVHVFVYAPLDPALLTGLASYNRTRHLADRAAYELAS